MDEKRLRGLMGISVRSGQAVFGEDGCRKAAMRAECGILLVDGGASPNTMKRYEALSRGKGIAMAVLRPGLIEEATGRENMAMGIRKGPLAQQVTACLEL